MELKIGTRLQSAVDPTQVIVVRAPDGEVDLRCGGISMVELGTDTDGSTRLDPTLAGGTLLGKRYVDETGGLELLCTKVGEGSLSIGVERLRIKDPKPLPSSD
jgi:hypothetical protein